MSSLTDLKMEGNPMRFPIIDLVQRGGAAASLKWCDNRHKRNVRFSKRYVVEALQRTLRLIMKHGLAHKVSNSCPPF